MRISETDNGAKYVAGIGDYKRTVKVIDAAKEMGDWWDKVKKPKLDEIARLKWLLNNGIEHIDIIDNLVWEIATSEETLDEESGNGLCARIGLVRKSMREVLFSMENDFKAKEAVDGMLADLRRKYEI